ncbi:DUF4302 domain-containing protein [Pedobacter sp.]|uniref:DUF4302 domain-containing protein n=1 Tax=Pedobacter sp. TaxID=1411316 RepID=UPI003D7F9DE1
MKKILIYTLFSLAIFCGCKKDNSNLIDGERPEDRVNNALIEYNDQLTGSPYGWKAYLYPDGGGGYSFYLNFDKNNRVKMYADLDFDPAMTSKESSYRLKAYQIPTLSFDTYNYMHMLADPDRTVFGGVSGWGHYSDFEFAFDKVSGDTIKLNGKMLDSKLILVKATKAEQDAYNNEELALSMEDGIDFIDANKYLYLTLGDQTQIQTSFDYYNKVVSLTWNENGTVNTTSTDFVFTLTGIVLKAPLVYKDKVISEFLFDGTRYVAVSGASKVNVLASATPILPLHLIMGITYSSIIAPNAITYAGWSTDFMSRRAAAATGVAGFNIGGVLLRLDRMTFTFNKTTKVMRAAVSTPYGTTALTLNFDYSYVKTDDGVFKFTLGTLGGNEAALGGVLAPILTQRIGADQFTLSYFVNPANGQILGQFKSVEHPDFYFSGTLQ